MKSTSLMGLILALAISSPAGPLPKPGYFRLTVNEVVQSDSCRVAILKIETQSQAEMIEISCDDGSGGSTGLGAPARKSKMLEGMLTFASMLCESNSACHVTTLLENGTTGRPNVSAHGSFDLAPGTTLESAVVLTATNGLYKLNTPLPIGKRNGYTMRIVVGNWNWEQLARNK